MSNDYRTVPAPHNHRPAPGEYLRLTPLLPPQPLPSMTSECFRAFTLCITAFSLFWKYPFP